jgi:hypothetical protein
VLAGAAGAAVAAGAAPASFAGCAASAGPATNAVAIRAAVKFLNMVFSSFVPRRRMRVAPIVEESFTARALNAP